LSNYDDNGFAARRVEGLGLLPLLAGLPPLFWAGNFVLGRALHTHIPPVALSFWRWALALLILLPFAHRGLRRQAGLLCRHWGWLSVLALLGVTNYNTFAYLGLQTTTATNGVLLASTTPVLIVLLSWLLLGQGVGVRQGLGLLLSLIGVLAIVSEGDLARLVAIRPNSGDLWILAASLDWALYSVCLRWRPAGLEPLVFLTATVALGCVPLAGLYAWELSLGRGFAATPGNLAALGYMALFPSVLAYVIWNRAVAGLGANRTGQYIHLMPVFGALFAIALLGERPRWFHGAGVVFIAGGIWLAAFGVRRQGAGGPDGDD
jgi:drug/metabolite transporter (DMT)-like permease